MKSAKTRLGFTGLVVCGAADLYAWATTGQEVLAAYGEAESVLRLVENTFTSALGKLLVGAEGKPAQGPKVRNAVGFPPLFLLPVLTNPRQSCIILYAVKKTALQS